MIVNIILIAYGMNGLLKGNDSVIMYLITIVGLGGIIIDNRMYQKNKKENIKK
jgi:hypothetical protein